MINIEGVSPGLPSRSYSEGEIEVQPHKGSESFDSTEGSTSNHLLPGATDAKIEESEFCEAFRRDGCCMKGPMCDHDHRPGTHVSLRPTTILEYSEVIMLVRKRRIMSFLF
jgi:hypothetical protein